MSLTVLIVDDEKNARDNLREFLECSDFATLEAADIATAREFIQTGKGDIVLLDVRLPDGTGTELLHETARMPNRPPIIIITGNGEIDIAVEAMQNGAIDFLQKPLVLDRLENSLKRAVDTVRMKRELSYYRQNELKVDFVPSKNKAVVDAYKIAYKAAQTSSSVLISGESGTGKEILAKIIYAAGPRSKRQFVDISCAAVQSTMLEAELFGHEKGAYTSADDKKEGLLEIADGGVLFLDEISAMPLDIQAKLLRVLQERSFRRLGAGESIKVDVQVVAASNRDLKEMIQKGEFREDLYYRINVIDIKLPPLREHKEDIPALVGHFIKHFNQRDGKNLLGITPQAMEALQAYDWPGNIRELNNVIERGMLLCDDKELGIGDLPQEIQKLVS